MITTMDEIHGLGPTHQSQLASAQILDHHNLLKFCRTRKGRRTLSEKTGLAEESLERWTVQAELMRIPGLGPKEAFLLEGLGIRSFDELKRQSATELGEALTAAIAADRTADRVLSEIPPNERVASWIADAAILTPKLGAS